MTEPRGETRKRRENKVNIWLGILSLCTFVKNVFKHHSSLVATTCFFFFFLPASCSMGDPSSLTRDWTPARCLGSTGSPGTSQRLLLRWEERWRDGEGPHREDVKFVIIMKSGWTVTRVLTEFLCFIYLNFATMLLFRAHIDESDFTCLTMTSVASSKV